MQCAYQTRGGAALQAICFAHDQKRLAVGGVERKISVYDIQEGAPIMNLGASPAILGEDVSPLFGSHHRGTIVCLRADPVNPEVMYSGSIGRQIFRWDLRVGPHAVGLIRGPRLSGDAMDISKDGQQLLTGSHCGRRTDKPLNIYDLRSFSTPAATLSDASMSFSWCADEPAVGVTAKQSSCMLLGVSWDSQTNRVIAAAGEQDNVAKAFVRQEDPARPLQTVGSLQNNAAGFLSTAVSPDGSRVAFGSVDGTVHLAQLSKR
jgi:WD40 repeat protein